MGDKLNTNKLALVLAIALISLFGIVSIHLILDSPVRTIQHTTYTQTTFDIPSEKIKIPYQKDSENTVGVLIKTDNLDSVSETLTRKGTTSKKHKIGNVIAANIPENELEALAEDSSVEEILPNRVVRAFGVPEADAINAPIAWNAGLT
ncbi:MAG TPA: hypothetical protein VKE88_03845, partial [Candidatus Nanoarchaeia archaeon]|nr:hypothetical protein [Candidatus Nanoarchaeia archaeon]